MDSDDILTNNSGGNLFKTGQQFFVDDPILNEIQNYCAFLLDGNRINLFRGLSQDVLCTLSFHKEALKTFLIWHNGLFFKLIQLKSYNLNTFFEIFNRENMTNDAVQHFLNDLYKKQSPPTLPVVNTEPPKSAYQINSNLTQQGGGMHRKFRP